MILPGYLQLQAVGFFWGPCCFFSKKISEEVPFEIAQMSQTGSKCYLGNESLLPGMPLDETHFSNNSPVSDHVSSPQSGHVRRMSCIHCDLSEVLDQTKPP